MSSPPSLVQWHLSQLRFCIQVNLCILSRLQALLLTTTSVTLHTAEAWLSPIVNLQSALVQLHYTPILSWLGKEAGRVKLVEGFTVTCVSHQMLAFSSRALVLEEVSTSRMLRLRFYRKGNCGMLWVKRWKSLHCCQSETCRSSTLML